MALKLLAGFDSLTSGGWASSFVGKAGVGLAIAINFWSSVSDSGLALFLHVTHFFAVAALDGLILGSG